MKKKCLTLFVVLVCLTAFVCGQDTTPTSDSTCIEPVCQAPKLRVLPRNFPTDGSMDHANPISLAGMNIVLSGGSSGQGNETGYLLSSMGANVYEISTTQYLGSVPFFHFVGDIRDDNDVRNFVKAIRKKGVTVVHRVALNAGRMMQVYPQDATFDVLMQVIANNFGGNYKVYFELLTQGLLPHDQDVRVGVTASSAAMVYYPPLFGYYLSKVLLNGFVEFKAWEANALGHKTHFFAFNPFGVGTRITCKSLQPFGLKTEVCKSIADSIETNYCPPPTATWNPSETTLASSMAKYWAWVFTDPNPTQNLFEVDGDTVLDAQGRKWDYYLRLHNECNVKEAGDAWKQSFVPFYYPLCATYPA